MTTEAAEKNETAEKRMSAIEKAADKLNKLLEAAYDEGDRIQVGMLSRVSGGKRKTDQLLVTID